MLQKAMMVAAALAAMAVAAATGVIALAFALYELLRTPLGPAGAAASVAALCAVAITVAGLVAVRGAGPKERHSAEDRESFGLMERLMELVRDKPMASMGVALAAGVMVMRNPAVIGVVLRTLMEAWAISNAVGKPKGRR
ncbi:MAG TPA: hypothetical protein VGI79_10660 [Caulobacteraceae bacterium]|jgi:hypothetical protein